MAGPVLAAVVITLTATPALASTGITSPDPGATVTDGSSVLIEAEVDGLLESGELQLRGPADSGFTTVARGSGTLSHRLQLRGDDPAYNGEYDVRLDTATLGVLSGTRGKRSFTVRLPPRQPSGLITQVRSDRQVRLQWDRGAEPDLLSYDVLSASGDALRAGLPVDSICGSSLCTTVVRLPSSTEGTVGFAVRAHRRTGPGSSNTVASGRSGVDTVTFATTASPSPSVSASGSSPTVSVSGDASNSPQPELEPLSSSSPSKEPKDGGARASTESPMAAPLVAPGGEQDPGVSAPLPAETPRGGQASGPGTSWTAVTSAAQRWRTAAVIVIVMLVAAHLGGLHWRGRSRRTDAGPGTRDVGRAAAATAATDHAFPYPSAAGAGVDRATHRRGAQPLRRVRSFVGAYRGRRRRL